MSHQASVNGDLQSGKCFRKTYLDSMFLACLELGFLPAQPQQCAVALRTT